MPEPGLRRRPPTAPDLFHPSPGRCHRHRGAPVLQNLHAALVQHLHQRGQDGMINALAAQIGGDLGGGGGYAFGMSMTCLTALSVG